MISTKLLLLGVVVVTVCQADVVEDVIDRLVSKVVKTAVTKAITSLEDLTHKSDEKKQKLEEESEDILQEASHDLKSLLERPHKMSVNKLIKTFVQTLKKEIPPKIKEIAKSIYKDIKKLRTRKQATQPISCRTDLDKTIGIYHFIDTLDFKELPEGEEIFMYEILAAGEKCELHKFLEPETMERLFILLDDMPIKYLHRFLQFLSLSLRAEGINTPLE